MVSFGRIAVRHLAVDRTELRSVKIEKRTVVGLRAEDVLVTNSLQVPEHKLT